MHRDEWVRDVVNAITTSHALRRRWLDELLLALEVSRHLPDSNGLGMMALGLGVRVPDENGVITVPLGIHGFHSLARGIPITTEDKPWHENDLDSIVYQCFRLILAPLIEAGIFHSIQRGYHEFFLSYFPDKLKKDFIERLGSAEVDRHLLAEHLKQQMGSHDNETKKLIDVLTTSPEQ
ncbi:MAG TPA: hypothetical protein VNG71_15640 [Pyrinomonadaceae bacterium]|nr:hypothetical protein [Pyrinomonadaceae bacterium]